VTYLNQLRQGTYVTKVIDDMMTVEMTFFRKGQFNGFCGSSGPSQSTILGSLGLWGSPSGSAVMLVSGVMPFSTSVGLMTSSPSTVWESVLLSHGVDSRADDPAIAFVSPTFYNTCCTVMQLVGSSK
jgi:hypothetical protein